MSSTILKFPRQRVDVPIGDILSDCFAMANDCEAEKVLVLIMNKDGEVRPDSNATNGECLWMMEKAKLHLLCDCDCEEE